MRSGRNIVNVHCLSLQVLIKARHLPPEQKDIKEIKVPAYFHRCVCKYAQIGSRNGNMTHFQLCLCYWRPHLLVKKLHFVQLASQQMLLEQAKGTSPCSVISTSHLPSVSFRTCTCSREKTVLPTTRAPSLPPAPDSEPL